MLIGVPKEIKVLENRVGLTPASVREAVHHGHQAIVERNAGQGIGASDDDYARAGATIVGTAKEVKAKPRAGSKRSTALTRPRLATWTRSS